MPYQYSANPLYVADGQSVQFRYEAPAGFDTIEQVRIDIGELTVFWIIETKLEDFAPDPYDFQNVNPADLDVLYTYAQTAFPDDGVAYTGAQGDPPALRPGEQVVTITGLDPGTQAPLGVSSNVLDQVNGYAFRIREWNGSGYNNWGSWLTSSQNLTMSNNDQIQLRLQSSVSPIVDHDIVVVVGSGSATWEVSTGQVPVNTPFPTPIFGTRSDQPLDFEYAYSLIPQILGLTTTATITLPPGVEAAISNFNTTFTNSEGVPVLNNISSGWGDALQVNNGQYVQLRAKTSASGNNTTTYGITIGDTQNNASWTVETGDDIDENPDAFIFQNLVEQEPGGTNYVSTVNSGSAANSNQDALIAGLTAGISVPVTLRTSQTTATNPRIIKNDSSPGQFGNVTVQNGDRIRLVMDGATTINDPSNGINGEVQMAISVGDRDIQPWVITNWAAPDTTPSFTPINEVLNRTPGGSSLVGPIGLTDFNQPITISATAPLAYNEFGFATGENVGDVLFSVNGGTAVSATQTGGVTVQPDPGGDPVLITIILQQPGNADVEPVIGLSHQTRTTITFGDATPFNLRSVNYAVKPIPPAYLGVWYTEKNASFDEAGWVAAGEDPDDAKDYYRQPKFDGYSIGTVIPVPKETVVDDGNYGYGTLEDRYPGFLECKGQSVAAADYPWLWEAIGNQYGGTATYVTATKTYSGNFNLPDYRGVRMVGRGIVDANRGSSAFVPVTSAGGSYELPGSTGGWWYVDDVDVAGANPLEQVIAPAGQTTGTESEYFTLGTPRTTGTQDLTAEVDFTITGFLTGTMNEITSVPVNVPAHEHTFITSETSDPSGDPVIPWGVRAYYGTSGLSGTGNQGSRPDNHNDALSPTNYWKNISISGFSYTTFDSEVGKTDGSDITDILPGSGSEPATFGNYWASPASTLTNNLPGNLSDHMQQGTGPSDYAGVLDTREGRGKIENYQNDGSQLTHSHLLGLDPVLDPMQDFSYGNVNGTGSAYRNGLANFGNTCEITFNQSEVQLELNSATFSWNNSTKPVPTASMDPQRKVPVITPFHKMKYIIKAY